MMRNPARATVVILGLLLTAAPLLAQRPFRGSTPISVLLCRFQGAPMPARTVEFYEDLVVNEGAGGLADYFADMSSGSMNLAGSVVRGWFEMDITAAEGQTFQRETRLRKYDACVEAAAEGGYAPPAGHLVVAVTSPDIDSFGFVGGAFLGEDVNLGTLGHEVSHGLGLEHSFSTDESYCNADWAYRSEYDDPWDLMSFANVFADWRGRFGWAGPGLNAYHLDRMGWLDRGSIVRFGADGRSDATITLNALSRGDSVGARLIRVPFDPTDPYRYFTVEYRVSEGWDGGFATDQVLIHEVRNIWGARCTGESFATTGYRAYLQRDSDRDPVTSLSRDGVRIETISTDPASGTARIRVTSERTETCIEGFVWRAAGPGDRVCVEPGRRSAVAAENEAAPGRRSPSGGAYGPDTCRDGFVWRSAYDGDRVCVPRASRDLAARENALANGRRLAVAAYGPNACQDGFVWRAADARDWVCVSAARRDAVREENAAAASRRAPGGGAYGPDTCRAGYVWRSSAPGDRVCVTPESRARAAEENRRASERLAREGS